MECARIITENNEKLILCENAAFSALTKGRKESEEKCDIRTDFQRDRDRIIHSKAFRRLKHKTQVFLSPELDHYRTRLTHTLEVSQIARTISRAIRLNEDLTEAIALGHDLGHTPFGHAGERALDKLSPIDHRRETRKLNQKRTFGVPQKSLVEYLPMKTPLRRTRKQRKLLRRSCVSNDF